MKDNDLLQRHGVGLEDTEALQLLLEDWRAHLIKNTQDHYRRRQSAGEEISDAFIEQKVQEAAGLSEEQLLHKMANNFHGWFPGGQYRDEGEYGEMLRAEYDDEKRAWVERLARDVDELLDTHGLRPIAERVARNDFTVPPNEKRHVITVVLMELLRRGYALADLRS